MKQFWRKNPGKNFHRKIFRVNYYFQCSIFFLILQRLEGMNMKIGWTSGGIMVLYILKNRSWIKSRMTGIEKRSWIESRMTETRSFVCTQDDRDPFVIPAYEPESGVAPPLLRGGWEGLVFGIIIFKTPSNSPLSGENTETRSFVCTQNDGNSFVILRL